MRLQSKRLRMFAAAIIISIMATSMAVAANWYDDADESIGAVSVTELADWMIQGNADFATLYIAKELNKVKGMNNLICIVEDGFLQKELGKLPTYKKWVVVTPDGQLSQDAINLLGNSVSSGIFVLEGGKSAWEAKVAAPSIEGLDLDQNERVALNNVRPFFQEAALKSSSRSSQSTVVKPAAAAKTQSKQDEEEEEEGC
jgi:hypothetical protein